MMSLLISGLLLAQGTVAYNIGSTSILAADPVGSGSVSIIGNAMDNNAVQITCAGNVIRFDDTRKYCVYDLTLVATAGNCLYVFNSVVHIGGLKTTASSSVIYANSKSIVNIHNRTTNVFTVYGTIVYFALAVTHSVFNAYDVDFNTTNLTAITSWLYVASMSFMDFRTSTYTKTAVSGSKYSVNENSVLYSASGGTILPGNSGGAAATNGLAL